MATIERAQRESSLEKALQTKIDPALYEELKQLLGERE